MSVFRPSLRLFSLAEARALLPRVRAALALLRQIRKRVVGLQALVDVEELAAPAPLRDQGRLESLLKEMEAGALAFHRTMEGLAALGAELKDLDLGLVDFYGMRGAELVHWCWKEGEEDINHWHTLDAGFAGRQKIEGEA